MEKAMKKNYLPIVLLTAVSCSTTMNTDSELQLDRVNVTQKSYDKPDFYVGDVKSLKTKRMIASVSKTSKKLKKLSNRQIYFLTMYKQYKQLGSVLGQSSEQNSCPSFHNVILEHKEALQMDSTKYTSNVSLTHLKGEPRLVSAYPVMALPYSSSGDLYSKLKDNNFKHDQEYLKVALNKYYKSQGQEIAKLCDQGVSPGYYIYENLVTYFEKDQSFHSTKAGLKALLKVPVLANMVILDNLKQESYALSKGNKLENWLLERSNTGWFKNFIYELNENRNSHISSNYSGE
jgi:hypothetical protein